LTAPTPALLISAKRQAPLQKACIGSSPPPISRPS
jgi:hypothetical protein